MLVNKLVFECTYRRQRISLCEGFRPVFGSDRTEPYD